ncbi:hypothetical protein PPYR_00931 [Photinus pyralis]|uniref:Uncharacterized protein n=2 Tax=Photinus pyralis TaxID=7054 RepID=A0A5N4B2X1_PHOPY|nr:protein nessun dorma-like [Photinus pyralis]XP_031338507.1 protein nessun dorma-like [Photinus pyralis]KAB0800626.1 hypothetical protein PPYR_06366 [Photinus pyralis]KAB0803961.1 hypothetical protein PPYR_00931 [Photinus pyralis]
MNPVITFNKSYEHRLQEYTEILTDPHHKLVHSSQVHKKWSIYAELAIQVSGWYAIWKIPRLICEQLKIEFPITVFVHVVDVHYEKLAATVKVLADDGDTNLSGRHFIVPLIELWPTKKQDPSHQPGLSSTADCLDSLRVFYLYIFMPWDLEEDDSINWVREHLESRLRLFYEISTNNIPKHTAVHINNLITEARHLHKRRCVEDDAKYRVRMMQIRNEVEFLENPLLRLALLKRRERLVPKRKGNEPAHVVVLPQGKVDDYITFLNHVKPHVGATNVRYKPSLNTALIDGATDDVILLSNCRHSFKELYALQNGGVLKGLFGRDDTVVFSPQEINMLDCCGTCTFENLTIEVQAAQCGLLVRQGTVTLKNCKFVNAVKSHTCDGIIVSPGAILNVIDCDIVGFERAIIANFLSKVHVTNTKIENARFGLTIYDNSTVKLDSCHFRNCCDFAVGVETRNELEDCPNGNFDMLKMFPFVTIKNVTGEGNGADCNINSVGEIDLIQDLLNAQSDDDSSDETLDTTIVKLK